MRIVKILCMVLMLCPSLWAAEDLSHITGTVYFADDFESGYQYMGSGNPHTGGGYFDRMGGYVNGGECPSTCPDGIALNSCHNTRISSDEAGRGAVAGSEYSLKTPYGGACVAESSKRDITSIIIPGGFGPGDDCYVRFYQKWTGDWNSATQQKFTKFYDSTVVGTTTTMTCGAHFSFGAEAEIWRDLVIDLDNRWTPTVQAPIVWAYQNDTISGSLSRPDDLVGVGDYTFETDRWYCIEIHFRINSDATLSDGINEAWIDGVRTFLVDNYRMYDDPSESFTVNTFEFQHIYPDHSATDQPTYMDNLVIASSYIGPMGTPDPTPPTPTITTSDPITSTDGTAVIEFSCTANCDDLAGYKWHIGSAPDATHGTECTSPATITGLSVGSNTVYIGAGDAAGNWGSDSITVNYSLPVASKYTLIGGTCTGCQ